MEDLFVLLEINFCDYQEVAFKLELPDNTFVSWLNYVDLKYKWNNMQKCRARFSESLCHSAPAAAIDQQ